MPFVNIHTARGLLDETKKRELHDRITDLMVEIEGRGDPNFKKFVTILIEEHEPQAWSFAGAQVTEGAIQEIKGTLA